MNQLTLILESCLRRTNSFIRFLLVGIVNTLMGLSIIFLLMNVLHVSYWISTFAGNSSGAVISYLLNRSFTFQSTASLSKSASRFILVILACYFGAYTLSHQLAGWICGQGCYFISVKDLAVLGGASFYTLANYYGQKFFVFNK